MAHESEPFEDLPPTVVVDCLEAVIEEFRVQAFHSFARPLCEMNAGEMENLMLGVKSSDLPRGVVEIEVEMHFSQVRR